MRVEPRVFVDLPGLLSRVVKRQDPTDKTRWIRDESWYASVKAKYNSLFKFLSDNSLLNKHFDLSEIDRLVITEGDLTPLGVKLFSSGAVDRWFSSFDRPSSKKLSTNVRYLERQLASF